MPNKLKDIFTKEPLERKIRLQFFDEKDYADFIEGIKPVGTNANGGIVFEIVNGVFKDFCIKAKNKPDEDFYFLIDEINRTDLSSLFGEKLSLIEKSYRDKPKLSYDKRNLVVSLNIKCNTLAKKCNF